MSDIPTASRWRPASRRVWVDLDGWVPRLDAPEAAHA
jgi:hypothetical protein